MNKLRQIFDILTEKVKKRPWTFACLFLMLIGFYFCLPKPLFSRPYASVLEDKHGNLIGAKIASDGQWRFPQSGNIPDKYEKCVLYFEDEYFYWHFGVNPVAISKAFYQNIRAGKVVRGGSTISQQVIRLSRNGKDRNVLEKVWELVLATRLEFGYSKNEIINLYSAHAPFGGNVVGLDMASWRYFGLTPDQLSWAQCATLAVLPNAPGLIFPGRNQQPLLVKRNRLLQKLKDNGVIDELTLKTALLEDLPGKPYDLPQVAPHLVERSAKENAGKRISSTLDIHLQEQINRIANSYYQKYRQNEVNNLAILVVDVKTRNVLAYVGNTATDKEHQKDVDVIVAPRSTGSVLKPFLMAEMLDGGYYLPNALLADIPMQISGFMPQNYDQKYDGAVRMNSALSRSLNIPFVLLLQEYGVPKFYKNLQEYHQKNINRHPDNYGLSLILGGAESNLWDLCRAYAGWSGTLTYFNQNQGKYRTNEFVNLNYDSSQKTDFGKSQYNKTKIGAGAIYSTIEAMNEVNRPEEDQAWKYYDSSVKVAWKTGTSYGNRDAWAIGLTPNYVVGVWVGNASGEGRPELTGVKNASPVMFDVFSLLPQSPWFNQPLNDLVEVDVCTESGYLSGDFCVSQKRMVPIKGAESKICPYHIRVYLDPFSGKRVNSQCFDLNQAVAQNWFVLPPVQEYYFKNLKLNYKILPPFNEGCIVDEKAVMDFIYPKSLNVKVYLTKDFNGKVQPLVVKIAHKQDDMELFWYVNGEFKGRTKHFHELALDLKSGKQVISVSDKNGVEIRKEIFVDRE